MAGPLSHLRVLDLSRVLAGPWATQVLGDLGADVIKVERPGAGDDTRGWGPPFTRAPDGGRGDAAYFLSANRNKRAIAVDFTKPEGQTIIQRLARRSHVVVENFKTGGLAKYGLDYAALKALNPGLVYCSITGFGQTGPYKERAGYDFMIQAMGGLMSVTGQPDGAPGAEPMKVGVAVADLFTGLYATIGILAALIHQQRTGEGQHVDAALLDCQVAMLANQASNYLTGGTAPGRLGNAHPNIVPYQVMATADGFIVLAVGNDGQLAKAAKLAGVPELPRDPRFSSNALRVANRAACIAALAPGFKAHSTQDWIAMLEADGVPCGPINTIGDVFADPQVMARSMAMTMARAGGDVRLVAHPVKYSVTPPDYVRAPPLLGADTNEVLSELLSLSAAELANLKSNEVIA